MPRLTMKYKFNLLLFFALVSVKLSEQHGTKGGSFSGSFSSSSSSSQSSSHSSSSSAQFSSSLNDIDAAGLKNLAGNLAHSGANAGSLTSSGGGAGLTGTLGVTGSQSGSFANSGSQSLSGGGYLGLGGSKATSGSGAFGGSATSGGVSCNSGSNNCGDNSGSTTGGFSHSGSGSYGNTGSTAGNIGGTGSRGAAPKYTGLGVGGGIGITGTVGPHGPGAEDSPISSGSRNQNPIKEIPVTENEEGSNGPSSSSSTSTNFISGSTGDSTKFQGGANAEPLPLLPTTGEPTKPSLTYVPGNDNSDSVSSSGSSTGSGSGINNIGITAVPVPSPEGVKKPTKGGSYSPGPSFSTGVQPPNYPSFPKPGNIGGSTSFGTGFSNNYGNHGVAGNHNGDGKKPCCAGPFPGPIGSIHASKPASSVPPVPSPGGSFPTSGTTTGVITQGSGSPTGSKGPCCKGPFPGPVGSIHDSKPASSVPNVPPKSPPYPSYPSYPSHPSHPSYPSSGSQVTGSVGGHGTGSGVTGSHPPFPGPVGSIHTSKPVTSVSPVPTVPSYPSHIAGTGSHGSSGTFGSHGTGSSESDKLHPPCCKPIPPGPQGSIHSSKPVSQQPTPVDSTGNHYNGPFPGPTGGISASMPAGVIPSGSQSSGHSDSGSYSGSSGLNKPNAGNGHPTFAHIVQKPSIYLHPPVITGTIHSQPIIAGYGPLNPDFIFVGKPTGGIGSDKPAGTNPGYATGHIVVEKPHGTGSSRKPTEPYPAYPIGGTHIYDKPLGSGSGFPSGTVVLQKPLKPFGYHTGSPHGIHHEQKLFQPQAPYGSVSGSFGSSSSGSTNKNDNGFATGNIFIQKPEGSVTAGKDLPSQGPTGINNQPGPSGSTEFGASGSGSGYATGNVAIQKPDGEISAGKDNFGKPVGSGSYSGSQSFATPTVQPQGSFGSSTFGSSGSGNNNDGGYATGSVTIEKPDGTISGGKDLPNKPATGGSYTGSGSGSFVTSSNQPRGSSGNGAFGPSTSGNTNDGGYASGSVAIQKPDGTITGGKDLSNEPGTGGSYTGSGSGSFVTSSNQQRGSSGSGAFGPSTSGSTNDGGYATGSVTIQKPDGTISGGKDLSNKPITSGSFITGQPQGSFGGAFGSSGSGSGSSYDNGYATGTVTVQKPDGTITNGKDISGNSGSYTGSVTGSGHGTQHVDSYVPAASGGNNGYATGNVIIQKPDGSFTGGKDLPSSGAYGVNKGGYSGGYNGGYASGGFASSGSGAFGSSGSNLFGLSGNGGFGHGTKGSTGVGSLGAHNGAGAGAYSGAVAGSTGYAPGKSGSYAGAQSGAEAGFTGLLKDLFGKHGLGGNLGVAGSGSFAKSHSFAGSSSYAGSSSSSFSGHY